MNLLEKGLNFCPSTKEVNKEELLNDTFNYCRNIRLKQYFNKSNERIDEQVKNTDANLTELSNASSDETTNETSVENERCEMKSKLKNPYFYPPDKYTPPNLEKFLATIKSGIAKLINTPTRSVANLTTSERERRLNLSNLTLKLSSKEQIKVEK